MRPIAKERYLTVRETALTAAVAFFQQAGDASQKEVLAVADEFANWVLDEPENAETARHEK